MSFEAPVRWLSCLLPSGGVASIFPLNNWQQNFNDHQIKLQIIQGKKLFEAVLQLYTFCLFLLSFKDKSCSSFAVVKSDKQKFWLHMTKFSYSRSLASLS